MLENSNLKLRVRLDWKAALTIGAALAILLALGFWQLDRADQKRRRQQDIDARLSAKPVAIEDLIRSRPESIDFQRVYLHGAYLAEQSIFLDDKFFLGQPGYEVLTPFRLQSSSRLVIVSRGWTALGPDPKQLPKLDTPSGELHLIGVIHAAPERSFFVDQPIRDEVWPLRLHHLNMRKIEELFPIPVFSHVVRLDEAMPGVLHRHWPVEDTHAGRSISYAIQWFVMALVLFIITLFNCTNIGDMIRSKRP